MTSAMPSVAVCARWNADDTPGTLGDVMVWCRISGPLQAGLLAALECEVSEPYRALCMIPEAGAQEIIDKVRLGEAGTTPNAMQSAKLRLFFVAAWHSGRGADSSRQHPDSTDLYCHSGYWEFFGPPPH